MEAKILVLVIVLFLIGTLSYQLLEGWTWIDSLYFSVTTLTTIGYGDLHPTNDVSKIFTIFYVIAGISIVLYVLSNLRQDFIKIEERIERHIRKSQYNAKRGNRK